MKLNELNIICYHFLLLITQTQELLIYKILIIPLPHVVVLITAKIITNERER